MLNQSHFIRNMFPCPDTPFRASTWASTHDWDSTARKGFLSFTTCLFWPLTLNKFLPVRCLSLLWSNPHENMAVPGQCSHNAPNILPGSFRMFHMDDPFHWYPWKLRCTKTMIKIIRRDEISMIITTPKGHHLQSLGFFFKKTENCQFTGPKPVLK